MTDHMEFWERLAKAKTHPTQLVIIERAKAGDEISPAALAEELGQPVSNVSYHARTLEKNGILRLDRTEGRRGALAHFYRYIESEPVAA